MHTASPTRPESPLTVVANRMGPTVAAQTWSLLPTGGRALCHAFLLVEGEAVLSFVDNRDVELVAPAMLWVPAGLGREIRLAAGGEGIAVSCSESLVWRTISDSSMAIDLRSLLTEAAIAPGGAFPEAEVLTSFQAMERELRKLDAGGMSIVSFALGTMLIHLWRAMGPQQRQRNTPGGAEGLVRRYRQLVELHFRDRVSVQGYATQLGVTRTRLTDACVRVAGMPPQAILHGRLIEEARRRLDQSGMAVEQVAYSLGFRDPAYFNRFFTRLAGVTPGAFKKAARAANQSQSSSFAAWP